MNFATQRLALPIERVPACLAGNSESGVRHLVPPLSIMGNEVPDTCLDGFAENAEEGLIEFRRIVEFGSFGKERITVEDIGKIIQ